MSVLDQDLFVITAHAWVPGIKMRLPAKCFDYLSKMRSIPDKNNDERPLLGQGAAEEV